MNHWILRCKVCSVIFASLTTAIHAADKSRPAPLVVDAVQKILQSESETAAASCDRRDVLNPSARPQDSFDSEWWQAGYMQSGKQWIPFEKSIAADTDLKLLDDYRIQRDKLTGEAHGHLHLAAWCKKNGLFDQERVHLLKVLEGRDSTVDLEAIYQRLGCKRMGNGWVSPQERRETAISNAESERSHKRWDSKLAALANKLNGTAKQRAQAEKEFDEISHFTAVPAIVNAFCMTNRSFAEYGVQILGQIPEYQASRALAGQAVFSPWKPIRKKAIEVLKVRRLEEFAPDLLLLLSNPIRPAFNATFQAPTGFALQPYVENSVNLNVDYFWMEETRDMIRVGIRRLFPTSTPASVHTIIRPFAPRLEGTFDSNGNRTAGNFDSALLELIDQKDILDFTADALNDRRSEMNERVGTVLSQCARQPMSSEPKVWWDWWNEFSSVAPPDQKNVVIVDERQSQPNIPSFSGTTTYIPTSCLVAGTPIWTECGPVPIEQIVPGDRVLSKDVTTGELNYKPVLGTTVRKPTPVHKFRVGGDTITASLGHHFWVSGSGWIKMRELAPQKPLHTVTGMQRISAIDDDGRVEKVYNLVVADFHTYFVGKTMILSHDVTTPRLTNVKVPGLAAE